MVYPYDQMKHINELEGKLAASEARDATKDATIAELRNQLSSDAKLERQIAIEYELVAHMSGLLDEQQRICATHDKTRWPGLIRLAEEQQSRAGAAESEVSELRLSLAKSEHGENELRSRVEAAEAQVAEVRSKAVALAQDKQLEIAELCKERDHWMNLECSNAVECPHKASLAAMTSDREGWKKAAADEYEYKIKALTLRLTELDEARSETTAKWNELRAELAAMTKERDGLLVQISYERNEVNVRQRIIDDLRQPCSTEEEQTAVRFFECVPNSSHPFDAHGKVLARAYRAKILALKEMGCEVARLKNDVSLARPRIIELADKLAWAEEKIAALDNSALPTCPECQAEPFCHKLGCGRINSNAPFPLGCGPIQEKKS